MQGQANDKLIISYTAWYLLGTGSHAQNVWTNIYLQGNKQIKPKLRSRFKDNSKWPVETSEREMQEMLIQVMPFLAEQATCHVGLNLHCICIYVCICFCICVSICICICFCISVSICICIWTQRALTDSCHTGLISVYDW